MTVVSSHNDWDPLLEVFVGRADTTMCPPKDISTHSFCYGGSPYTVVEKLPEHYDQKILEEASEDLDTLSHTLENLGIKVHRPEHIDNSKSFFSLENVSFSYPGSKIFPIRNINLNIEKASKIGITGKTGAGKSTLFHLMLGLLTPQKGNIFYKGSNIFSDLNNWRNKTGYISQNIYLLDASIKKNIAFNFLDEPIDEQKLNNAINIANLEQKIANLPNGVNTVVGNDGVKLSGGERQRIALARAIYREPSIFFMDESTSALDTKTEEIVMNNIKNKFKDKTMIIIAHRKSTIEMCDKVLNLKDGSLI